MCHTVLKPAHVGLSRADAVAAALAEVDGGVVVEAHAVDVTSASGGEALVSALRTGAGCKGASLVLLCSQDRETRLHVNRLCLAAECPVLAACAADDAMSGVSLSVHNALRTSSVAGKPKCKSCRLKWL